jgi:hypothetical protein
MVGRWALLDSVERDREFGLGWMLLAQLFFAGMNVCTRLGGQDLQWAEIGARALSPRRAHGRSAGVVPGIVTPDHRSAPRPDPSMFLLWN